MAVEKLIVDTLVNDTAVKAIVKNNISFAMQEQNIKPPAVTFQRVSTIYTNVLCIGDNAAAYPRFQVDCWDLPNKYDRAIKLFTAVKSALLRAGMEIESRTDTQDPTTEYMRISADFRTLEDN